MPGPVARALAETGMLEPEIAASAVHLPLRSGAFAASEASVAGRLQAFSGMPEQAASESLAHLLPARAAASSVEFRAERTAPLVLFVTRLRK